MQHVLKAPKVKLSIVINVFFSPAAVVVQSSLTFQSSTWQELGLARSANTHYVAARSESLCLIHQSSQLFRDGTLLNGPMPLILHLAKKSRWFFFPPTPMQTKSFLLSPPGSHMRLGLIVPSRQHTQAPPPTPGAAALPVPEGNWERGRKEGWHLETVPWLLGRAESASPAWQSGAGAVGEMQSWGLHHHSVEHPGAGRGLPQPAWSHWRDRGWLAL